MKTTLITLTALSLTLTAFMTNTTSIEKRKAITTSDQMAERVVAAFKKSSSSDYATLFPTISDFKDLMKESAEIYGSYLNEAQREFARSYESKLMPAVKESFETILNEGRSQGIDWSKVRYIGIETTPQPQTRFSPVPVTILFSSNGIEHRIVMERALVIDGQWKVSQFLKLY